MLRKATPADLDTLAAFRHEAYGGSKAEIAGWLQNIVGIDNVFLVEQEGAQGGLVSMVCAVPVELRGRRGVWLCGMATAPQFRGRSLMTRLLDGCLRAFSASGFEFAVAVPETARAAARLRGLQFADAFALRILRRPIARNLWARAEFDAMTVRRLMDARLRYQPGCVTLPEQSMNEVVSQLYHRGVTIVSNQRGYGLYYVRGGSLQFVELQADNDHSADILLEAAREHTGCETAQIILTENQSLYLGEGKRCGYGMLRFLQKPFPLTDVYFRLLV